ncbi:MAG: hypothetical protein IH960_13530 [Chloroflexi bacterium]|nr:hypothetical protein [Chloroflexota bacterium]
MRRHSSFSLSVMVVAAFVLGAAVISCGSDDSAASGIPRIYDPGKTLAIEDLQAIGFKKSKTYDVEGLTGADSAYYGFWAIDPYDRRDYEVRFFPSHSDAVELGTAQADERSGEDAILDEDEMSWPQGVKDARQCSGDKASGPASHGIQNCKTPKYWDYSIYANMILLCSGGDVATARELCNDLLAMLEPQPDEA